MSTTSPNFNLVIATTSDVVSVTSHISNNFSSLDSILGISHTGTGQLKTGLPLTAPVLINPVISGTASGGLLIIASTGQFNTITATGGALTVNTLNVGTYSVPATVGAAGTILTIVTSNAQWVAAAPGTGAAGDLSNLAAVAINTSLNTFAAGFVTVNRIISTSGALTGLTSFQATAGTFAGLLTALGTVSANVLNVTGGSITAGSLAVGTFALPGTIAATGVLRSLSNTATWYAPAMVTPTAFAVKDIIPFSCSTMSLTSVSAITFSSEICDLGNNVTTGVFTAPSSGIYQFSFGISYSGGIGVNKDLTAGIAIASTRYSFVSITSSADSIKFVTGTLINTVASGATVSVYAYSTTAQPSLILSDSTSASYFVGQRLFEF